MTLLGIYPGEMENVSTETHTVLPGYLSLRGLVPGPPRISKSEDAEVPYINDVVSPPYPQDTCTHIFIAALFMKAKRWKQTKCPSMDGWMDK